MTRLQEQTLAEIVTSNYRTAAVFEKYHLDFCCKGKRSLEQACEEKQLNMTELLSELELTSLRETGAVINFEELSLSQLVDHIIAHHHQYVKNEMPLIALYLQKIAAKHGGRHPEMLKVFEIFIALKEELEMHMQKEEQILFPRIKAAENRVWEETGQAANQSFLQAPIHVMEEEHDNAGEAMTAIRELTNNYTLPEDACTTYKLSFAALAAFETDLHHHVHLENNILFPKALRLFSVPETIAK
jgi:regulator of cell morphogenesis and NO signaling